MPESNPTSQPEKPHSHLRHPVLDWSLSLLLLALFITGLVYYPPHFGPEAPHAKVPDWLIFFGRFHPIFVHLPIGVFILSIIMEIIAMAQHRVAEALRPAITFTLGVAVLGASFAVLLGILLSREGGFEGATVQAHQALGLCATAGMFLALFIKLLVDGSASGRGAWIYRSFLVLSFLIMTVGAHFGGNMSHGNNYLTEFAPPAVRTAVKQFEAKILAFFTPAPGGGNDGTPPPAPVQETPTLASNDGNPTVYAALVSPILEKKCNGCHNAEKTKGKLRMDSYEMLIKGGENGDTIVPGDPVKSLMIARMTLAKDDDDHMPPDGKEQISKEEIELLSWWVKNGASKDMKLSEAKIPDELRSLQQTLLNNRKTGSAGGTPPILLVAAQAAPAANPAIAEAMKKINGSGASLSPVAADPSQLRFTALNVARDYTDENLKDLTPILEQIVALDLAKTKVSDASCALIAKMPNLRELHLENTAVTDAGVAQIKGLSKLEYLNLYGTKVTDKTLDDLGGSASLKALYLWKTAVTKPKAEAFKTAHPAINLNIGWDESSNAKVVAVATPPPAKPLTPAPAPAPAAAPAKPEAKPAAVAAPAPKPAVPAPAPVAAATKPATPPPAAAPAPAAAKPAPGKGVDPNAIVYKDIIAPILEAKCVACHGDKKSKGKLRMNTYASLLKGGSDGATTVIPNKAGDSLMVKRTALPVDDDDHMPPKDEKQLTKEEVALLKWWIENGASESATLASAKKTPEIDAALAAFASAAPTKGSAGGTAKTAEKPKAKPLTPEEKKTVAAVTAKMTALNASLMPLALDTEQLRFGCVNAADKIGDKELVLLEPAAAQIVWVDLGRTKVTDAGLATIAKMKNLEKLHLENTAITDAGLAQLASLGNLEYLNLYGTKVTDAGIAKLASNKALKKLFVWQTAVTHDGAKKLEAAVPGLTVNVGLSEADIVKLNEQNKPPEPPPAPKKADAKAKPEEKKPAATPPAAKPEAKPAAPAPAPKPATTPPAAKPEAKAADKPAAAAPKAN